jgi:hypothetical protein
MNIQDLAADPVATPLGEPAQICIRGCVTGALEGCRCSAEQVESSFSKIRGGRLSGCPPLFSFA